jgi:hypothetical protein
MSRIKIRVSAGIFEVSLVRVIEEFNSVEVLWDRGIKREFKWGSVVFGHLEGQTIGQKPSEAAPEADRACLLTFRKFRRLTRIVIIEPAGSSFKLSQPGASATTGTTAESMTAHVSYQPRVAGYPYAVGGWGYHYPTFPTTTASSSVTPGVTQADIITNILASGTFPYPYTAVQYSTGTGQSPHVPPLKYPYGAPALSSAASTAAPAAPAMVETPPTAPAQEQTYNGIQWKQPYTGPRDPPSAVEPQGQQNESSPSVDTNESMQSSGGVDSVESSTNDSNNPTPPIDDLVPTSSTGVTA